MKYIIEIIVLVFIISMIINMIIIIYNTNIKNTEFFLKNREKFENKEIEECDEYKEWINNNDLHEWLQKKEGIITSKEYNLRQDIKKIAKNKFCKKNKK